MSDKEIVGFHKGALNTLVRERQEFQRLMAVVDQLIQLHIKSLKDLGVDLEKESKIKTQEKRR